MINGAAPSPGPSCRHAGRGSGALLTAVAVVTSGLVGAGPAGAADMVGAGGVATEERAVVRTTECSDAGKITTTITRSKKRVGVGFELSGVLPLEEYGFGADWDVEQPRRSMLSGSYDGATRTTLLGTADFSGFSAPRNARITYRFVAYQTRNRCVVKGVIRRPSTQPATAG